MVDQVRVYGHPRSGNHVLASMIHRYLFDSDPSLRRIVDTAKVGHVHNRTTPAPFYDGAEVAYGEVCIPYGQLLGDHRLRPDGLRGGCVYIFRDGRDVALSVYNWDRMHVGRIPSFDEWIRTPQRWGESLGSKRRIKCLFWEHWRRHVENWLSTDWTVHVRYEDLMVDPRRQLTRVARRLHIKPPTAADIRAGGAVGYNPSRDLGSRGKWRSAGLSGAALALYDELVPPGFRGRLDP